MSKEENVSAIVLRRKDWGESDRLMTVLTLEHGKIEIVAKGARKSSSRLSAATEPLVHSQMHYAQGRRFSFLTQVQIINSHSTLRTDYDRLAMALALAEIYTVFTVSNQRVEDMFRLFEVSLSALEIHPIPLVAMIWASLKVMEAEGVLPSWLVCTTDDKPLEETPAWVSPNAGGYVSLQSASRFYDRFQVPAEVLIGLEKTGKLPQPPPRLKFSEACFKTMCPFIKHAAHAPLPALDALTSYLEYKNI